VLVDRAVQYLFVSLESLTPASLCLALMLIAEDSWGRQGRRVASDPPENLLLGPDPTDAILALTKCNTTNPSQKWTLDNATGHLWTTALSNGAHGSQVQQRWCVGASTIPWGRPAGLVPCDDPKYNYDPTQDCGPPQVCKMVMSWTATDAQCVGVPAPISCRLPKLGGMAGEGCDLVLQCGSGETISGIKFADWGLPTALGPDDPLDPTACEFQSAANCTSVNHTIALIEALCVGQNNCTISTSDLNHPDPCSGHHKRVAVAASGCSAVLLPPRKSSTTFVSSTGGGTLGYVNELTTGLQGRKFVQNASSGPLPHARWFGPYGSESQFYWEGNGSQIVSASSQPVIDDDCVGGVKTDVHPQDWCIEAVRGGNLEVWVAELSGHRLAVALINRSPFEAKIVAKWADLGLPADKMMSVYHVWGRKDMGTHADTYACKVAGKGSQLLVLSSSEE
jgi:hypothetical protein